MNTFIISSDLIPANMQAELDVYKYITFKMLVANHSEVRKGDVIGQLELKKSSLGYHGQFSKTIRSAYETLKVLPVISEIEGYISNGYNSDELLVQYCKSNIRTIQSTTQKEVLDKCYELVFYSTIEELEDSMTTIKTEITAGQVIESNDESVYLYLMVDTSNGYYKIGISNHPEYREKTLQSEKPTIEMVCCKQYPNRAIARTFEQSLHKLYSSKHIRGEWFSLDSSDVAHMMEVMK